MNRVVQFDETSFAGLRKLGLERFLVEFDERGNILREIGIGQEGHVIHLFPGTPTLDEYGIMGPNVIALAEEDPAPHAILMEASDLVPFQIFDGLWASD